MDGLHGHLRQHRGVGVQGEAQAQARRAAAGVNARGALRPEKDVVVAVAPVPDVQAEKGGPQAHGLHARQLFVRRHLAVDEQVAGVPAGTAGLGFFHGADGGFDSAVAVAVDDGLLARAVSFEDGVLQFFLGNDGGGTRFGAAVIALGHGSGVGLDGAVHEQLDAVEAQQGRTCSGQQARFQHPLKPVREHGHVHMEVQAALNLQPGQSLVNHPGREPAQARAAADAGREALGVVAFHGAEQTLFQGCGCHGRQLAQGFQGQSFGDQAVGAAAFADHVRIVRRPVRGNAQQAVHAAVDVGRVDGDVQQQRGPVRKKGVHFGQVRAALFGNGRVVETVTHGNGLILLPAVPLQNVQGRGQVGRAAAAGIGSPGGKHVRVAVGVDEAGIDDQPVQIRFFQARAAQAAQLRRPAHGFNAAASHPNGFSRAFPGVQHDDAAIVVQGLFATLHTAPRVERNFGPRGGRPVLRMEQGRCQKLF